MPIDTFAARTRAAREAKGLSTRAMASLVGVSKQAIHSIEQG